MSYLHCPVCQRAYNLAISPACPSCPVHATPVDATDDIVAAAERLAGAMARATATERGAAVARMARLALPGPGGIAPTELRGEILRSIRTALEPRPVPAPARPQPLLASLASAVLARLDSRPRLQAGLRRAALAVRARVRALAA